MHLLWLTCVLLAGPSASVDGLRCEGRIAPAGIDAARPRLSWRMNSAARGERQTAWQVVVKRGAELVWDSGRQTAEPAPFVPYGGPALASVTRYTWRVRLWDRAGQATAWSEPATFVTGKLRPEDWHGEWIGASVARQAVDPTLGIAVEAKAADEAQWVSIDLGEVLPLDRVVLHPMRHNDPAAGGWTDGYGFPLRFRVEADGVTLADQTAADVPNPGWRPVLIDAKGQRARTVKLTVTRLWKRGPDLPFVYTLGELEVFSGGRNIALGRPVTASSSVEGYGWGKAQLVDGKALAPAGEQRERLDNPHGALYLRRVVQPVKPVTQAVVCFSGLGYSELAIDGRRVGDYLTGPGFVTYNKRVPYLTFDVTDRFVAPGARTLDVTLVDGWYGLERDPWVHHFEDKPYIDQPKLRLDLHLRHADGTETVIGSDGAWLWSEGEITRSWIPLEDVDARRTARRWRPVAQLAPPTGQMAAQREPFTRVVETITPPAPTWDAARHTATWNLGREVSGFVRLRAAGPPGTEIHITTLPTEPRPRTSRFILAGTGSKETYQPRFVYAGMCRVEVSGLLAPPEPGDLTVQQISSLGSPAGAFRCSDEWQNWLNDCVRRTAVAYTTWLPADPVREWKGWVQDIETMFWSSHYLFDSPGLYERWQQDMLDGQAADGNFPNIAPGPFFDDYNSPWWGGCAVWLPWQWYLLRGDRSLLETSYPAMARYVDYLTRVATPAGQDWGLLDWLPVEETPRPIINTPAHYLFARIVSQAAEMLGKPADARRYTDLAEQVRAAFNARYLDPATGIYGQPGWQPRSGNWQPPVPLSASHEVWWTGDRPCTQAGQVLPLALGMVPPEQRARVEAALLRECAAHRQHLSTGFVSGPYLLPVLRDLSPETAWAMASARDFPSWWSMTRGSGNDLLKETWAGGMALMPSLGGNVAAWQFEALAGIRPDPSGPGYRRIIIRPQPAGDMRWVDAWYDSPYGRIRSAWRLDAGRLTMDITIPPSTSATVYVPTSDPASVTEGERRLGVAVVAVEAGRYRFAARR
ncbi:MAG: alpha-L-rhamnosidase N-terminal domain-containing protein [Armatimonadetes bacterium]|nr:alpha-L-rhamnosidase N-terminal domain-containing protein [Armatimonadota bacterium]